MTRGLCCAAGGGAHVWPLQVPICGTHCGGRLSLSSCFMYAAFTPEASVGAGSSSSSSSSSTQQQQQQQQHLPPSPYTLL
jgi:hypothetical protein